MTQELVNTSLAPNRLAILRDRADMLQRSRSFFADLGIVEVDCPILSTAASIDAHIDLITASCHGTHYLHSSPEYGMKRLLAEGIGDVYQLSHVFRHGEVGTRHNPEFTLVEWYRVGILLQAMVEETIAYLCLFLGELPYTTITYREAFLLYAGIDYVQASDKDLMECLKRHDVDFHEGDRDTLLNQILGVVVEPHLGSDSLTVLTHYPASQAALAQTCWKGDEEVSERFEVYYQGVELANGYHELRDVQEQRDRLEQANQMRLEMGKDALPIDEKFLEALPKLPDCCGVAVGFDRLMMLRHDVTAIKDVLPFGWSSSGS